MLDKLRKNLNADALFVASPDPNLYYLTGLSFGSYEQTSLVLTRDFSRLYTSNMEVGRAKKESGLDVLSPKDLWAELKSEVKAHKVKRLAVNKKSVSLYLAEKLQKKLGVRLVDFSEKLARMRMVKGKREIALIKKAGSIAKKAYSKADFSGSESDVASSIECAIKKRGATIAFETIIAGDKNSSFPHHRTSLYRPKKLLLCDFGARRGNYVSDLTRMHYITRSREFSDLDSVNREAVDVARAEAYPGSKARDVDSAVRSFFGKKGVAKYFTHSLGHGIGVEVHERPLIGPKSIDVLKEGMVFTIEPGVYLKNFGCRLESDFLVTRGGCRLL